MPYSVLVPYDPSEAAEAALSWAADLVRAAGGSMHLLRVLAIPPPPSTPFPAYSPFPPLEDVDLAKNSLDDAITRHGVTATTEVVVAGNVADAIVRSATERRCDLIVMGTHGRAGLERAVLGSVADAVVRHAKCPVVTVRAHAGDKRR